MIHTENRPQRKKLQTAFREVLILGAHPMTFAETERKKKSADFVKCSDEK